VCGYWRSLYERSKPRLPLSTAASCLQAQESLLTCPRTMLTTGVSPILKGCTVTAVTIVCGNLGAICKLSRSIAVGSLILRFFCSKSSSRSRRHASGAEARHWFCRPCGTTEVVPSHFRAKPGVFQHAVKSCPITKRDSICIAAAHIDKGRPTHENRSFSFLKGKALP
jgi:hypothetical protein